MLFLNFSASDCHPFGHIVERANEKANVIVTLNWETCFVIAFGHGCSASSEISDWLDEATGALAAFGLRIEGLSVANFDDEGTTLTAGRVTVLIEMQPELGLPVQLASDVEDLELLGPDGLTGDIRITFQTSDVNAGTVQIEPPV